MKELGSNFQKIFRAVWKKVPTIILEHASCAISPDCWYNQRTDQSHRLGNAQKKGDQHFGTVSMTKYSILL